MLTLLKRRDTLDLHFIETSDLLYRSLWSKPSAGLKFAMLPQWTLWTRVDCEAVAAGRLPAIQKR